MTNIVTMQVKGRITTLRWPATADGQGQVLRIVGTIPALWVALIEQQGFQVQRQA